MRRAKANAMRIPTGTSMPTEEANEGTAIKSAIIKTTGATAIFQFLLMYTTPSPPKRHDIAKSGLMPGD